MDSISGSKSGTFRDSAHQGFQFSTTYTDIKIPLFYFYKQMLFSTLLLNSNLHSKYIMYCFTCNDNIDCFHFTIVVKL
jgi:hypothetical protein